MQFWVVGEDWWHVSRESFGGELRKIQVDYYAEMVDIFDHYDNKDLGMQLEWDKVSAIGRLRGLQTNGSAIFGEAHLSYVFLKRIFILSFVLHTRFQYDLFFGNIDSINIELF